MISQQNDAVSEVIGVILMIAVTIILIGVVALVMNSAIGSETSTYEAVTISGLSAGTAQKDNGIAYSRMVFELTSGSGFVLDTISVRISTQEHPENYTILDNGDSSARMTSSVAGNSVISLGDRFYVWGEKPKDNKLIFNGISINHNEHITYTIYDGKGRALSSGVITYTAQH